MENQKWDALERKMDKTDERARDFSTVAPVYFFSPRFPGFVEIADDAPPEFADAVHEGRIDVSPAGVASSPWLRELDPHNLFEAWRCWKSDDPENSFERMMRVWGLSATCQRLLLVAITINSPTWK